MATPKVSEAAVAGIEVGQVGPAPRGLWTRLYQPALLATGCDGEAQKKQQPSGNGAAVVATVTSL